MDSNIYKKKIKLFKLLEKLKKRDLFKEMYNLNLINSEITKTDTLIDKINLLIKENKPKIKKKILLAASYKDKSKLINILNNQKIIAKNKKDFLFQQKNSYKLKFSKKLLEKNKVKKEIKNKVTLFDTHKELELEQINIKPKNRL